MNLIPRARRDEKSFGLCDLTRLKHVYIHPCFQKTRANCLAILERGLGHALTVTEDAQTTADISFCRAEDLSAEGYTLEICPERIVVTATDASGALYATQTLRILGRFDVPGRETLLPCRNISDAPAMVWRGINFDESRHFFGMGNVKRMLDLMSLHKLNVLHWHLTDDVGWRIEIKRYPRLTEVGSKRIKTQIGGWNSTRSDDTPHEGFYTQDQIREIVAYADALGIMIVPEIDMPAHFAAAFAAYGNLACRNVETEVPWYMGGAYPRSVGMKINDWNRSACVGNPETMEFIRGVIDEICTLFPAPYFHIGGDEAPLEEWEVCPRCQATMKDKGLSNVRQLLGWFMNEVQKYCASKGKRLIGWNEILAGKNLDPSVIVQYWIPQIDWNVSQHLARGGEMIVSKHMHFYFDMSYSQYPLKNTYKFSPDKYFNYTRKPEQILGVEGAVWTEWIGTREKLDFQMFPRTEALAEVAWNQDGKDWTDFKERLELFKPILDALGVNYAEPAVAEIRNPLKRRKNVKRWYASDQDFELEENRRLKTLKESK